MKFYDLTFPRKEAKRAAVKRHGWDGGKRREEGKDRRGNNEENCPALSRCSLGRDDGQKEGPFAQIRLALSTRDRERYT